MKLYLRTIQSGLLQAGNLDLRKNDLSDIVTDKRLLKTRQEWNQKRQQRRQAEVDQIIRNSQ